MIPFTVFKIAAAYAGIIVLGVFLVYLYIKNRLMKWVKEIEEDEIYG